MNTLVMNLQNLAVTEHTVPRTGLAGTLETSDDGVFLAGGDSDDGAKVTVSFELGAPLGTNSFRQRPRYLYLFGLNLGDAVVEASDTRGTSYQYYGSTHDRATRFVLGRGLRDNYLFVKVQRGGTKGTIIDRLEFEADASTTRRM